jgi:hypothetical protein
LCRAAASKTRSELNGGSRKAMPQSESVRRCGIIDAAPATGQCGPAQGSYSRLTTETSSRVQESFSRLGRRSRWPLMTTRIGSYRPEPSIPMICSRCGTARPPIGPRHGIDGRGRDCLRYACWGCGYSWTEPARDRDFLDRLADAPGELHSHGLEPRRISMRGSASR